MAHEILKRHFEKLKQSNSSFSMRALGIKLGISHVFVGRMLNGSAKIPRAKLEELVKALKIDPQDAATMRRLVNPEPLAKGVARGADTSSYKSLPEAQVKIMRKWWNLAILDLLTCDMGRKISRENIPVFLPMSKQDVSAAVDELIELGLVLDGADGLRKSSERQRFSVRGPSPHTRAFYEQTLALASKQLQKTSDEDYSNRLILGFTCAVNRARVPDAKRILATALRECAEHLSEGPCDEVYIVQGQMFSVLKS